jgi:hypothetical protein
MLSFSTKQRALIQAVCEIAQARQFPLHAAMFQTSTINIFDATSHVVYVQPVEGDRFLANIIHALWAYPDFPANLNGRNLCTALALEGALACLSSQANANPNASVNHLAIATPTGSPTDKAEGGAVIPITGKKSTTNPRPWRNLKPTLEETLWNSGEERTDAEGSDNQD